jgi:WD40 repeat protein
MTYSFLRQGAYFLAFAIFCMVNLHAQTSAIFNVGTAQFPRVVSANFFALDSGGRSIQGLTPERVQLVEDGIQRRVLSLSCPPPTPPQALSVVLTIDVSGSMAQTRKSGKTNMEVAKEAAHAFLSAIRLGTTATLSEAAVTSFDQDNYLNQDWTTDKASLQAAVDKLAPQGGTDYNAGFINKPAGAVDIARTGKNKRIIIFLTDGIGNGTEETIVSEALRNEVTLYCVTVGLNAPQVLRNAAQRTGGVCIENVTSAEEAANAYLTILQVAQGAAPCQITWESTSGCAVPGRRVEMSVPASLLGNGATMPLVAATSYSPPESASVRLSVEPRFVQFFNPEENKPQERVITVSASNANFTVRDILFVGDSSLSIEPRSFMLKNGESIMLKVLFTPRGGGYALGDFTFLTDTCSPAKFYASAYSLLPPVSPTLRVVFPNGGEQFLAGTDSIITWTGVSPRDTVRLEFSIDSGRTWQLITNRATGLTYKWLNIPNTPSNRCLMRATQLVGNPVPDRIAQIPTDVTLARMDVSGNRIISTRSQQVLFWSVPNLGFLSGMNRHQTLVTSIDVSQDSTRLATADDGNNIVTWEPASGRITGGLVGNIGRVVAYSPDSKTLAIAGNENNSDFIKLYDAETNQLVRTITISGASASASIQPRRIIFTQDGQTLGLVRANGTVLFWRISSVGFGTSVNAPWASSSRVVRDAAFQPITAPGGNFLALGIQRGSQALVEVWNWRTQRLVRTFTESTNATRMNSVNFSRDGSRIITGYNNGVSIWEAGAAAQEPTNAIRFASPVSFVEFHPDGRRFLAVSGDRGFFYTFSDPLPLQSDTSDRVWSIVAPAAAADSLDMGVVTVNIAKDSVVRAFLRNTGTYPIRIDSIFFSGVNPDDFGIVSGLPAVIPVGGTQFVEFRFRPSANGLRQAIINIVAQNAVLEYSIRGIGVSSALQISPTLVDFGAVLLGSRRDTTVRAVVRNTGLSPITISGVELGGPDNRQFFLLSGGQAFTLAAGESRSIVLRFAPTALGRTSGSLLFNVGTGIPVVVRLFGAGVTVLPQPPCTLRLQDTSGRPNDTICMSLVQSCSASPEFSTSVTVLVSFNATLLAPQSPTPQGVVANGIRYIPITLNLLPVLTTATTSRLDTRPLENLCFGVLLGNTTATTLRVEVIQPPNAYLNVTTANFRLITSQAGGTHLYFSPQSRLRITSTAPNPVNDQMTIAYETPNTEALTLTLLDVFGRTVLTQMLTPRAAGANEAVLVVRDVPAGIYVVRLRSARESASQRVLIVR